MRMSVLFLSYLISFNLCFASAQKPSEITSTQKPNKIIGKSPFLEDERNTIEVVQNNVNSVVFISTTQLAQNWIYGTVEVPRGAGSGFLWDNQGHIVTNYHVVDGAESFIITFQGDNKEYKATLVGGEPSKDIAVLKLEKTPTKLKAITPGSSKDLIVGQKTIAIGNPFGLDHTVTSGIVSALGRKIEGVGGVKIYDMIQTDASINQGNSGGPLLNSAGELIGMNTVIFSTSGSSAGIGFAVPVDTISQIVPQLIKYGKVTRPGLGIAPLPDEIKMRFGVKKGVVIAALEEDGPAEKSGLKGMKRDIRGRYYLGDIVTKINNDEIENFDDIFHTLEKYKVGDEVKVTYLRDGKEKTISLKLYQLK